MVGPTGKIEAFPKPASVLRRVAFRSSQRFGPMIECEYIVSCSQIALSGHRIDFSDSIFRSYHILRPYRNTVQ